MRVAVRNYLVIVGVALLLAGAVGWRQATLAANRERLRQQGEMAQMKTRLEAERARLVAEKPPAEEVTRRETERGALVEVLSEIESIRRRVTQPTSVAKVAESVEKERRPSLRETPLPAAQWRESGTRTPEAALETALWAAATGNLERLMGTMALDDDVRMRATALYERFPAAMHREVASPEQLVAMLTAHAVPLGTAYIVEQSQPEATEPYLLARLADAEGRSREVKLSLRSESGQWRIVVPSVAIDRFAARMGNEAGRVDLSAARSVR